MKYPNNVLGLSIRYYFLSIFFINGLVNENLAQSVRQQIYAVSPVAANFVKAGSVPINLSSGVVEYAIPFYEIRLDDFSWNIQFNYSFAGLRLEEQPGDLGLGWSLAGFGGSVTREIRGLPDEHPRGYFGSENRNQYVNNFNSTADLPLTIIQDFVSGKYDAEPDRFIVSVGDLSFSFFINGTNCSNCPLTEQQISVSSNADLAKVIFQWDKIEITDAEGVVYLFQEKETSSFYSADVYIQEKMQFYTGAWHLSSITTPTGRQLKFLYDKKTIRQISHGETYDRTASPFGERIRIDCGALGGINNSGYAQEIFLRDISHQRFWSSSEIHTPFLRSIHWNNNELVVIRKEGLETPVAPLIDSIIVRNSNRMLIKAAALNYERQARTLLDRIVVGEDEIYDFDYFQVTIPTIEKPSEGSFIDPQQNPYAQDYWGFANGKGNSSAIPELGGDRRPDLNTALQGALRIINWPTGGITKIYYEQNKVRISAQDYMDLEPEQSNREFSFDLVTGQNRPASSSKTVVFDKPTFARISHQAFLKGTSGQLTADFQPLTGCAGVNCQTYYSYAVQMRSRFPEKTPFFSPVFGVALTGDVLGQDCRGFEACAQEGIDQWILIEPGTYLIDARISNSEYGIFQMQIEFFDPDADKKSPSFYDVPAAGIRVSRTKDCPDPGSESGCIQKIYQYKKDDGFSSGIYLTKLDQEFTYQVYDAVNCRNGQDGSEPGTLPLYFEWNYPAIRKYFRSLSPLISNAGSPVYYDRVEILDDVAATSGREVKYFRPTIWGLTGSYPYTPLPEDKIHGIIQKTEWISGAGHLVRTFTSDHQVVGLLNNPNSSYGLVFGISKEYRYTPLLNTDQPENIFKASYLIKKYIPELPSKRLLISEFDDDRQGVLKEKFYRYNMRLQLKSDSIMSSNGSVYVTTYQYPPDKTEAEYQLLANKNRISIPIETNRLIDGKLFESQQIRFRDWFGNEKIIEPVKIQRLRSNTTITDTEYLEYGLKGNPKRLIDRDGINKILIWNNDQDQLLAEVYGANSNEVFYTSFEEGEMEGNSGSGDSYCGQKSRIGGFSHQMSGLDMKTIYRLSWFEKDQSGSWSLNTRNVKPESMSYSIKLTGQIDDVRFHPVGAEMTTYTTEPLLGPTSVTSPDLQTRFYQYDSSGRLIQITDSEKNILAHYNYQYGKKNEN